MNMNPVGWFEIYVNNMDRARTFYQKLFETELIKLDMPNMDMFMFPQTEDAYGINGALVKMDGMKTGGNSTMVYFNCEDCGEM